EQGNIIHTNNTVKNRLGYTADELQGLSVLMVHPAERREEAGRIVGEMLSGQAEYCPVPLVTKSGIQIPVETRVAHGFWNGNSAIFGITKDISRLRLSEEKFSKVFYLNPSACGLSETETHHYIEVNDAFSMLLGYNKEEVIGKTAIELGIMSIETTNALVHKMDSKGRLINAQTFLKTKNGELKPVLLSAENIVVQDKVFRFTIVQDMTEHNAVQELIRVKEHAVESERLKSAFLANLSHEIHTPMSGVLGFTNLLKKPDLAGEKRLKYIETIEKSGARMLHIINDIVDISKIESGLMKMHSKPTDICLLLKDILNTFEPQAHQKNLKFILNNTLPEAACAFNADVEKLNAILSNIVINSIKYTTMGSIELGCKKTDDGLEFYVKDSGIGIPKDRFSAIFDRFTQVDISNRQAYQGAGLGLSITKAYVEMHGGTIWVESEESIGSTFRFTIPYEVES
ncbi:MAG: PAS domain-containing sensor histidine kinase, partial [Candidatus Roizmanbacteria bacterium]